MSAGISRERKYRITRRACLKLARKFNGQYKNWSASGEYNGKKWTATIEWGNMSNGESVGMWRFTVDGATVPRGESSGEVTLEAALSGSFPQTV